MIYKFFGCLCLAVCCAFVGCTGSSKGDISGVVKYKGEPLPGGTILFYGQPSGQWSAGINEDGSYTVTGVTTGTAKIAVFGSVPLKIGQGTLVVGKTVTIPDKYRDPEKSGLICEVHGGSQTHPVDLTD